VGAFDRFFNEPRTSNSEPGTWKPESTGVQEYRSTGVQEYRSTGVQEFRSTGVAGVQKRKTEDRIQESECFAGNTDTDTDTAPELRTPKPKFTTKAQRPPRLEKAGLGFNRVWEAVGAFDRSFSEPPNLEPGTRNPELGTRN
jgi:hypothetical protein